MDNKEKAKKKLSPIEQQIEEGLALEKPYKMLAAISFAVVMLGVGIPIWWTTTTVYRAPFRKDLIQQLENVIIEVPIKVKLVYAEEFRNEMRKISDKLFQDVKHVNEQNAETKFAIRLTVHDEKMKNDVIDIVKSCANLKGLDKLLAPKYDSNDFGLTFLLINPKDLKFTTGNVKAYFGSGKVAYIFDETDLAATVTDALLQVYVNIGSINHMASRTIQNMDINSVRNRKSASNVWSSTSHSAHTIDVYFFNSDSHNCDLSQISDAGDILRPFAEAVKDILDMSITYHHVYDVNLGLNSKWNEELKAFTVKETDLSHVVTPIEQFVPTVEPSNPVHRLVLYLPQRHQYPLYIVDKDGVPSIQNGFSVASWGGVSIWNGCVNKSRPEALPDNVLASLIGQLRVILDMQTDGLDWFDRYPAPICQWEIDRLMLHSTVDNVLQTIGSMTSLERLLDKITNIVISDQVAMHIDNASQHSINATQFLHESKFVKAMHESRQGLAKSEQAFFDPSLLALLYFPDDQKYAIYVPLFLPAGLPVLLSIRMILTYFKKDKMKTD